MADIKITDLTAYTDPVSTDVVPIVDVGSDVTKKVSIADLLENAGTGTAAAPSFSFDGDNNTGLYQPGADQVAISTGGTEKARVNSNGDVLIGATLPSAPAISLNANGTAAYDGDIQVGGNANNGSQDGTLMRSPGLFQASRPAGSSLYVGYTTGSSSATSIINSDGDATFAGDVETGDWNGVNTTGSLVQAGGGFVAARDVTNSNKNLAYLWQGRDGSPRTSTIAQDGSAFFAGTLTQDKSPAAANDEGGRIVLGTVSGQALGDIRTIRKDSQYSGEMSFKTHQSATGTLTTALTITSSQEAKFVGPVSIGGTAAANTIDSYEEGTFTPVVVGSTTSGTPTYGTNGIAGKYVRTGQTCHIEIYIDVTGLGGAAGFYRINGLPFNADFSFFGNGYMRLFATVKDVVSGAYGTHNTNYLFIKLADGLGNLPVQTGKVTVNASYTIL